MPRKRGRPPLLRRRLPRSTAVRPERAPARTLALRKRLGRPVHKRFTSSLRREHRRWRDCPERVAQRTFDPSAIGARETMMQTTRSIQKTGLAAAVVVSVLALVAAGAPAASAAPAATQTATSNCWLQVVNDWLAHGQVTGLYPIPCYTQAIQHLSAYPDIKQYSSAIDDIHRALLAAIHEERGNGPGGSLGLGGGGGGGHRGRRRRIRRRDRRPGQESLQPACGRHRPGERAVHSAPAARARRPRPSPVFDSSCDLVCAASPGPANHPRARPRARGQLRPTQALTSGPPRASSQVRRGRRAHHQGYSGRGRPWRA